MCIQKRVNPKTRKACSKKTFSIKRFTATKTFWLRQGIEF